VSLNLRAFAREVLGEHGSLQSKSAKMEKYTLSAEQIFNWLGLVQVSRGFSRRASAVGRAV
jgi:hypothetical protein